MYENEKIEVIENTEGSELNTVAGNEVISENEIAAVAAPPKKKGFMIYTSLIVAACILLGSVLVYGVYKLFFMPSVFIPNIEGVWVNTEDKIIAADTDTPVPYLIFNNDGTAVYSIGTLEYYGPYSTVTEDEVSLLTINVPYAISGTFYYSIEGNDSTDCMLSLSYDGQSSIDFVYAQKQDVVLEVSDDFTLVEEVVGEWYSEEQGVTYSVYSDGTMKFDLAADDIGMHVDGVYTVSDGVITFEFMTDITSPVELPYEINENGNIMIQGIEYINKAA